MSDTAVSLLGEFASTHQIDALEKYYDLLIEWNKVVNLTAVVERQEAFVKHFWDSLSIMRSPLFQASKEVGSIIDVGTGAGLPGIPLAICNPDIEITLCDALRKRTDFLRAVVDKLQLHNVHVYHARSEDFARVQGQRNRYDLVVARAVAKLNVLTELLIPFARPGGHVVCYKGPEVQEEIEDANEAVKQLKAEFEWVQEIELPLDFGGRSLVAYKALHMTPKKFPRKAGTPQKQPL